ncbi:MAG TPA: hypothetical protein VGE07_21630 [Herpetosiphonaceae bacterium]
MSDEIIPPKHIFHDHRELVRARNAADPRPKKSPKVKTEGDTSLEIRTWLEKKLGALPTRVNSGKLRTERGGWIHLAPKGTSDTITLLPVLVEPFGWLGIYLAVEVKKPGGKPTPEQARFIAKVRRLGGIGFYATSRDDARNQLFAEVARRFGPAALAALEKGFSDGD